MARREFLQVGVLGLGGLSLPGLLRARAEVPAGGPAVKDTAVVLLFLTGGPSHIETFDPKMAAPSDYRSVTGEVATRLPGVTFGGTFPQLAHWAHRLAVVRSFTHNTSDHTKAVQDVMRGGNPGAAGMGAITAHLRGASHPTTGMPTHAYVSAQESDPQFDKERLRLLEAAGPGPLGGASAPFPLGGGQINDDLILHIPPARLEDRRALHAAFDQIPRTLDARGTMADLDRFEQQAFDLVLGKSRAAFDLSREDRRVLERYDTSRFRTGLKRYRPSALGRQLLLARRLCEAGCSFVTVHNPGWDMHGGDTQLSMARGMEELGRPVDHAVAAFLEDVEQRGLAQKILLVITGEFGRTPKINRNGGRDHWPRLSTLALAGGGLRMGQVVGQSTDRGESPRSDPATVENLLATVLHVLFDERVLRGSGNLPGVVATSIGRARPIAALI
jgi:uncharacterized protein (DUF1501 family)